MITPQQCRAARAWLGMSQAELAALAGCSRETIRRFEGGIGMVSPETEAALVEVFEDYCIAFRSNPAGIEAIPPLNELDD
jgi:DNA-binding XRE family transcriptional regulator